VFPRYEQFIRERQYLMNVSPATVRWYTHAEKWLACESPTQQELNDMVIRMREAGLKATGANAAIRAINAYLKWSGSTAHIKQMKEPTFVPPTFTAEEIKRLLGWRPSGFYDRRLHLMVLVLLDTGARISEVLGLHVSDVDLDDLLLTLSGKGRKQRRTPCSLELRKTLFRYVRDFEKHPHDFLLSSKDGHALGRNVCLRDVKRLCVRLGFRPPERTLHCFRHTFAVNYLRRGGSVFHLQKTLGHSSLEMSRRYASLNTDDLSAVHERISLLGG
jgi:integrase/recombinase XerD